MLRFNITVYIIIRNIIIICVITIARQKLLFITIHVQFELNIT